MIGIELPKAVDQVLTLYAKNGNTLWVDAISKELESVTVASPDKIEAPIGHQFVQCNMVFDIKREESDIRLGM